MGTSGPVAMAPLGPLWRWQKERLVRFTRKDDLATALVAAVVVIYLAYLALDGIPMVRDVTGMAAVGLILGLRADGLVAAPSSPTSVSPSPADSDRWPSGS